jgi:hypothetical protein
MTTASRALKAISAKLGTTSAKAYIGEDEFRGIGFSRLSKELREAILVAVTDLPEDRDEQA